MLTESEKEYSLFIDNQYGLIELRMIGDEVELIAQDTAERASLYLSVGDAQRISEWVVHHLAKNAATVA